MEFLQKIKGGIYNGIGFVLVVGITGVAYGAYVTLSNVSTGDPLTASNYNQLIENVSVLKTTVDGIGSGTIPVGAVIAFNGTSCPTGWTAADGSGDEKNTSGANTTLDLRGTFIRGMNGDLNGRDVSRTLGDYQADELKSHHHQVTGGGGAGGGSTNLGYFQSFTVNRDTTSVGGTETRPRNVALLYCVKQ
ncbi:MAG: hypothetical protein Q8K30_06060 [Candidatus Gracilibacteria bacterium]|nr:hypothetical protein [Candidatus Gracilibacteria bacterium]